MSAQTGRPSLIPPPPTSTRFERAAYRAQAIRQEPNPVWMREMRQAARLTRTPLILATLTAVMALLMCSIGGLASTTTEPAKVGMVLYHTYFSLAFAVVTWLGPAVAASTIASERSGRTWHALMLTGLGATTIARGKFLAALSYITMYIVMLAPVGVLPFLFGGVTATEVIAAFVVLFLVAVLSVAFGLSVSSRFNSSAAAILITLIVAFPLSNLVYVLGGPVLAEGVNELWSSVPGGAPVWLPIAYARAPFGFEYLAYLVVIPLALVVFPAWFLYESTIANMAGPSDDRSSGIRRWFLVTGPCMTLASLVAIVAAGTASQIATLIALTLQLLVLFTVTLVFAGEPLGPSRRVRVHWERRRTSALKRFLGPGVLQANTLLFVLGVGSLVTTGAAGIALELVMGRLRADVHSLSLLLFTAYAAGFLSFTIGLSTWLRARAGGAAVPRVLASVAVLVISVGPWIVMAIGGALADQDSALILAAPSPTFAFVLIGHVATTGGAIDTYVVAGSLCAGGWGLLGLVLYQAARLRVRRALREHAQALAKLEAALEADEQAAGAGAIDSPPVDSPPVDNLPVDDPSAQAHETANAGEAPISRAPHTLRIEEPER
ncbi:MAG: ABC transporter permease [Polyangiaceae bacterium]|nr:ABC transporter permease [Polyangiaceae bacterium]MCW5790629.1 ABC transporter permease [Polyangiaceae bacterium]